MRKKKQKKKKNEKNENGKMKKMKKWEKKKWRKKRESSTWSEQEQMVICDEWKMHFIFLKFHNFHSMESESFSISCMAWWRHRLQWQG